MKNKPYPRKILFFAINEQFFCNTKTTETRKVVHPNSLREETKTESRGTYTLYEEIETDEGAFSKINTAKLKQMSYWYGSLL